MFGFDDPLERPVTFAQPGEGEGIARTVWREAAALGDVVDNPERYARIARAAWQQQSLVENSVARGTAQAEGIDRVIAAVKAASGVEMQNPMRGGYRDLARLEAQAELGDRYRREVERNPGILINYGMRVFERQLADYGVSDPRLADAIASALKAHSPQALAREADAELKAAMAQSPSTILSFGAAFVGAAPASFRDPINVAGLMFGAGPSAARSVAGRIVSVGAREAGINAGLTAATQPFSQAWRAEAGLESGWDEALNNILFGAATGAAFGGGVQAVREAAPPVREMFGSLFRGEVPAADVARAVEQAGLPLDGEARAALDAAVRIEADDATVRQGAPREMPAEAVDDVVAAALARAEDPDAPPPPLPIAVTKERPDRAAILDETRPAEPGHVDMVDGKPVRFERFDPANLGTDATAMQYKGGGDASGVTDRLRSVTRWDPLAGGRVFVFERADGSRVIADGHQRLGLARRLQAEGLQDGPVDLVGHLFREADGWSATDVRALAAKKNMQEGSGTPLDAARVLRDRPDVADGALPKGGTVVRDGLYLARLSDEAFAMVNAGVVPEAIGARVGALAPDPATHAAIVSELSRFNPGSQREADIFIGEAMEAGFAREIQQDMFGTLEQTVSLIAERTRVLSEAVKVLGTDKRVFGTLQREADRIEGAGNRLARDDNEAMAQRAGNLSEVVARLARRTGPVSAALNEAAAKVKAGDKASRVARSFLDDLQTIVERDGLPALLAEPQLRPAAPVAEPGTPQALAAVDDAPLRDDMTVDMFGEAAPEAAPPSGAADLMDQVPVASRDSTGARLARLDEALAEGDAMTFAADLVKGCKT